MKKLRYRPENPEMNYKQPDYEEHLFNTGEVLINYAMTGSIARQRN